MRTVEQLIHRVRSRTRNRNYGANTAGASIPDEEFVDVLQEGQELCQETIAGVFSKLFLTTTTFNIDVSQASPEEITLPFDILFDTRLHSVEFAYGNDPANYYILKPVDIRERESGTATQRVRSYSRAGRKIILTQVPSQNSIVRVTYDRVLRRLNKPQVVVSTGSRSGTNYGITAMASYTADTTIGAASWGVGTTVNVYDKSNNTLLIEGATISAISVGAGTATLNLTTATYTTAAVDAATASNLRVVEGGETIVSELPEQCEKFLVAYAIMAVYQRDGSSLAGGAERRYGIISTSLQSSYISEDTDMPAIPETDY